MAAPAPLFPPQDGLLRITLFAALAGLLAGAVVIVFRWTIEAGQANFLPGQAVGNYESLAPLTRVALPLVGSLCLGLLFHSAPAAARSVGIVHVLERLSSAWHRGRLPLPNALMQFVGGAIAIISGHSVDREGPSVHLGAASGSFIGQRLGLSDEGVSTLASCGIAAAIAASFNTPLAGVIFVIEVIRVEYAVSRFMPVILAAVVGAVSSRVVYGPAPAFDVPALDLGSLVELPYLAVMGLIIGGLAASFIGLCEWIALRTPDWSPWRGFALAGLFTGLCALWTPQIMGVSYDTLDGILNGRMDLVLLLEIVVFKLVATAVSIGMRVPGGLIGPTLVIGSAAGAAFGLLAEAWFSAETGSPGFYAMVGMIAMMGAALSAPLAALIALLELTANSHVILPGLLTVVTADGVARSALGKEPVFVALLKIKQGRRT